MTAKDAGTPQEEYEHITDELYRGENEIQWDAEVRHRSFNDRFYPWAKLIISAVNVVVWYISAGRFYLTTKDFVNRDDYWGWLVLVFVFAAVVIFIFSTF